MLRASEENEAITLGRWLFCVAAPPHVGQRFEFGLVPAIDVGAGKELLQKQMWADPSHSVDSSATCGASQAVWLGLIAFEGAILTKSMCR